MKPDPQTTPQQTPITILAIESSCDETACAVVQKEPEEPFVRVLASTTATSLAKHKATSGIVPEVAAREQMKYIMPVIQETVNKFSSLKAQVSNHQSQNTRHNNRQTIDNPPSSTPLPSHPIDYIAVTVGPGLVGSLLVGIETARSLSYAWNLPIIPVNHVQAHPYANFIGAQLSASSNHQKKTEDWKSNPENSAPPQFPILSWVISGGHTQLSLMRTHSDIQKLGETLDDAAGECFDKCARVLGYDYPGGPFIDQLAQAWVQTKEKFNDQEGSLRSSPAGKYGLPALQGQACGQVSLKTHKFPFLSIENCQLNHENLLPRPLLNKLTFDMSFSGLKTAFLRTFKQLEHELDAQTLKLLMAYELQEAVSDIILKRTQQALKKYPEVQSIIFSGGVAANSGIRKKFAHLQAGASSGGEEKEQKNHMSIKHSGQWNLNLDSLPPALYFPPLSLCTDNAEMIGAYAAFHLDAAASWKTVHLQLV